MNLAICFNAIPAIASERIASIRQLTW